ncbi:MAG: ATP-dependent zinc metalloprotease FtsH, partial [Actinomycetota bacterium]
PMSLGEKVDQPFLGRDLSSHPDYSDQVAAEIDEEIRRLVDEAHQEAWEICVAYRSQLDAMVGALIEKETVEKQEVEQIFSEVPKRAARGEVPRRLKQEAPVGFEDGFEEAPSEPAATQAPAAPNNPPRHRPNPGPAPA